MRFSITDTGSGEESCSMSMVVPDNEARSVALDFSGVCRGKEAFSTSFPYVVFLFLLSVVSPVDLEEEIFDTLDVNAYS